MRQGMPSPILGSLLLVARARLRFLVSPRYALLERLENVQTVRIGENDTKLEI